MTLSAANNSYRVFLISVLIFSQNIVYVLWFVDGASKADEWV